MRGIVLIAGGNPMYGKYALNLCLSIKHSDPTMKVCLLYTGSAISHIHGLMHLFDQTIELEADMTKRNGINNFLRPKAHLYDLSPYEETMFIDADVILFFKPISQLFEELKDVDFTIGSRDKVGLKDGKGRFQWAESDDIIKETGYDGDAFNLSSEFIYFKRTDVNKQFFEKVKQYFDNPGVPYTRFAAGVPDELAFQMAMCVTGVRPHKDHYLPFYWSHYGPHKKMKLSRTRLYETFWGYSMGGSITETEQRSVYDALVNLYGKKFGIRHQFKASNKRDVLTERSKI